MTLARSYTIENMKIKILIARIKMKILLKVDFKI
jgi:hypothetical protein